MTVDIPLPLFRESALIPYKKAHGMRNKILDLTGKIRYNAILQGYILKGGFYLC